MTDLIERAAWTFAQAFVAAVLMSLGDVVNVATLKAALVAAVAAGLSAVKTGVQQKRAAGADA